MVTVGEAQMMWGASQCAPRTNPRRARLVEFGQQPERPGLLAMGVGVDDVGDGHCETAGGRDVEVLVGAVGVGIGSEYAR